MATPLEEATRAVERALEQGRSLGRAEAASDFFGKSAGVLTLGIFADAAESAGTRLREHDAAVADAFVKFGRQLRAAATAPQIASTTPQQDATAVPVDQEIHVTFAQQVDPATVLAGVSVAAASGGAAKAAEVTYDKPSKTARLVVEEPFSPGVTYRVSLLGIRNEAGFVALPDTTFEFATVGA